MKVDLAPEEKKGQTTSGIWIIRPRINGQSDKKLKLLV
jgi:hypothetical protein